MYKKRTELSSAEIRQLALDYINANPNSYAIDVASALGWARSLTSTRLLGMTKTGELSFEKEGKFYKFTALKKVMGGKPIVKKKMLGTVTNTDPRRMPIKNQGGQGAVITKWRRPN